MLFQLVQLCYWLALSTWSGSALFVAMAMPVILRTVRENNPILSHVLSVNLDGQHSTLLGGTIALNLISRLRQLEIICAAVLAVMLIVQPFVINLHEGNGVTTIMRSVIFLAVVGVVGYDWKVVWPKVQISRNLYLEHADEPEIANPALDSFDREQRKSIMLLYISVALLLGMVVFSSTISTYTTLFEKAPN